MGFETITIPLINFNQLAFEAGRISDFISALRIPIPGDVAAMGPNAELLFRRSIANGLTDSQAMAAVNHPDYQQLVQTMDNVDNTARHFGGYEQIPSEVLQALAMGETLLFGEASQYPTGSVVVPCGTSGTCEIELGEYLQALENNPNVIAKLIEDAGNVLTDALSGYDPDGLDIGTGGEARVLNAMIALLNCSADGGAQDDLAAAFAANPAVFQTLVGKAQGYNAEMVVDAVLAYEASGDVGTFDDTMNIARHGPQTLENAFNSMPTTGEALVMIGGVAYTIFLEDGVGVVTSALNGDVIGVIENGVGFLPIGKVAKLGKIPLVQAALKRGGETLQTTINKITGRGANGGLCSFHGDTLVLTSTGLQPISDLNTTMSVWSRNSANGDMGWKPIQAHYSNPYEETVSVSMRDVKTGVEQTIVSNRIHPYFAQLPQRVRMLHLTAAQSITTVPSASEGHHYEGPILNGYWVDAGDLKAGYRLLNDEGGWVEVVSVAIEEKRLAAFNLTVAEFHTYFVTASKNVAPVWVHNSCFDNLAESLGSMNKTEFESPASNWDKGTFLELSDSLK